MARFQKTELLTAADIIDALGGLRKVMGLTGAAYNSVCNWKTFNAFPARYYFVMAGALERRDYKAAPELWNQRRKRKRRVEQREVA